MGIASKERLHFLDGVRAFAILLMLQGHFIDSLLAPEFRDEENIFFSIWEYMRGITAPVFFTITGTVFSYLLIRWEGDVWKNPRIRKGLRRGLYLIAMGYLLRVDIFSVLSFHFPKYLLVVDVLHCIGLSIIGIILLYALAYGSSRYLFQVLALGLGVTIFIFERAYYDATMEGWPLAIQNYFVRANSVFTILPWIGYAFLGAYLGTVFRWLGAAKGTHKLPKMALILILLGSWFMLKSAGFLMHLYGFTEIQLFHDVAYFNYLFQRLGDVLIVFAIFMLLEPVLQRLPLFLEMGRSTLSIYILHFVVLFGSWFGLGLSRFFYHTLGPREAILGAIVFVLSICTMVYFWNRREKLSVFRKSR